MTIQATVTHKKVLLLCLKKDTYFLRLFSLYDLQSTILDDHFKPNIFGKHFTWHKSQHTTESLNKGHL